MNATGVMFSALCLLAALDQLRKRADLIGRCGAAMLFAAAYFAMALVALDQHRQCEVIKRQTMAITVPATQIVAEALRGQWKYEAPDGGVVTFQEPAKAQAQLVGADGWHANKNDRL